jgi:hypothetical protein
VKLSESEFKNKLFELLLMTREEVEKVFFSVQSTMLEAIISAILLRAHDEASIQRLGFIVDRLYGKYYEPKVMINNNVGHGKESEDITFLVAVNENGRFVKQRPIQLKEKTEIIDI